VRRGDSRFSIVPFPFPFPLPASEERQLVLLDRRFIESEGRVSALRRRSRLDAGCAGDLSSVVLLKREELTRGPSTGGGSSSSDEPDECLLIPAGVAADDACLGVARRWARGFGVVGLSEWTESGAAVTRYSMGRFELISCLAGARVGGSGVQRCGFTEIEGRHS
jgi:hypothetical protein